MIKIFILVSALLVVGCKGKAKAETEELSQAEAIARLTGIASWRNSETEANGNFTVSSFYANGMGQVGTFDLDSHKVVSPVGMDWAVNGTELSRLIHSPTPEDVVGRISFGKKESGQNFVKIVRKDGKTETLGEY